MPGRDAQVLIGQEDGRDYVWAERSFAVSLLREIQEDGRAAEALAPMASGEFWFVSLLHSVLRLARLRQVPGTLACRQVSAPLYFELRHGDAVRAEVGCQREADKTTLFQ